MTAIFDEKSSAKVTIDELTYIFYDEEFLSQSKKVAASFLAKEALIDFIITNGDYAVA